MILNRVLHRSLQQHLHFHVPQTLQHLPLLPTTNSPRHSKRMLLRHITTHIQRRPRRPRHRPHLLKRHAPPPTIRYQMQRTKRAARTQSKHGDALCIAAKRSNVGLDPLQARALVAHPDIQRPRGLEPRRPREPKDAEAVVERDKEHGTTELVRKRYELRRVRVRVVR
jgi:hypothetical protein